MKPAAIRSTKLMPITGNDIARMNDTTPIMQAGSRVQSHSLASPRGWRQRNKPTKIAVEEEIAMPIILWLLGVPLTLVLVLWFLGVVKF